MSGWDKDENGDYTPPPLPPWILFAALVIGVAFCLVAARGA